MREILVEVDKDGAVTVKTQGFQGPACVESLKQLIAKLNALGVEVKIDKQRFTDEYYRQTQTVQNKQFLED